MADPRDTAPDLYGPTLGAGALVGAWLVEEARARGGFGVVYRATHVGNGRRAAVKVMHREMLGSESLLRRFEREIEVVRRLRHENVVELYETGSLVDGRPYYAMEWVDGPSIDDALRASGPFGLDVAVGIARGVGAALAAAHEAGVVHRDLKASNVLLAPGPVAKVVDFGIAKVLDDDSGAGRLTATGVRIGTPATMAPEQILGQPVGAPADVYALGVLVFQMLSGRLPFLGADGATDVERMHLLSAPPRLADLVRVPAAVDDVIQRCLEKEPSRRPAPVTQVAVALAAAAAGTPRSRSALEAASAAAVGVHVATTGGEASVAAARRACQDAGFPVILSRPGALLCGRLLPDDVAAANRARAEAFDLAIALAAGDRALELRVHVAPVRTLVVAGATQLVGGPLLAFDQWLVVPTSAERVSASAEALEGRGTAGPTPAERPR